MRKKTASTSSNKSHEKIQLESNLPRSSSVLYLSEGNQNQNATNADNEFPRIEFLNDRSNDTTKQQSTLPKNVSEDDLNQLDENYVLTSILPTDRRKFAQRQYSIPSVTSSVDLCDQNNRYSVATYDTGLCSDNEIDRQDDYMSLRYVADAIKGQRKVSFQMDTSTSILNQRSKEPKVIYESPAKEWEAKQRIKHQQKLTRKASREIRAGWRVRKALHSTTPGFADKYYLENVQLGKCEEIQALFVLATANKDIKLNKECTNQHGKRALKLAIENNDAEMCKVLLQNKVQIRDCLFVAIEQNFFAGVEVILSFDKATNMKTSIKDYHFPCCITPIMLAAHNNNYEILELLTNNGHQFEDIPKWEEGIGAAWESAQERRMYCKAAASPAYIALLHKRKREDPMEYCMSHIRIARMNSKLEPEFNGFYQEIICQLEQFMCSLLDQIRSTSELSELFEYDFINYEATSFRAAAQAAQESLMDVSTDKVRVESLLYLLDKACKEKLVSFVSHQNAQLTIAYMQYRYLTFIRKGSTIKQMFIRFLFGLMFPVLSILYVLLPNSQWGSSPPTVVEWIITSWVLGKWVQELQEMYYRGFPAYIKDWWNYNDICQLLLLSSTIALRAISYGYYNSASAPPDSHLIPRSEWGPYQLRFISEGLTAWAYVFVFLRVLAIIRAHRVIGPLQISLTKMTINVLQFLTIFVLIVFAFALGLSELYWYYGTPQGKMTVCKENTTCKARPVLFNTIQHSLYDLFWTLFGYIDISDLSLPPGHYFTEAIGFTLFASYHVVAIIVLLNMLIAMMTKSYEDTSANEENEWKFHRTALWVRFIKREVIRPPPMNLIPNPYRIIRKTRQLHTWIKRRIVRRSRRDNVNASLNHTKSFRLVTGPSLDIGRELLNKKNRRHKYRQVLTKLLNRYKYKVLFSEEGLGHNLEHY